MESVGLYRNWRKHCNSRSSTALLVSKARARDRRGGVNETIQLVPELRQITRITDDMLKNFQ